MAPNKSKTKQSQADRRKAKNDTKHDDHSHELEEKPCQTAETRLPVIVLTGYLGAGKTTLLNYFLKEQRDKKIAVIENEVGEVSIDDALVEQKPDEMAEELIILDNGCVCCTIRGDLVNSLHNIANKTATKGLILDGILIELTGAADPAPVVQTFMMDAGVRAAFYVDNVIALVDAKHAIEKLDESEGDKAQKGTACAQIAFSSTVLLNKIDLVEASQLEVIEKRIKEVNSAVEIIRCEQARVPIAKLFNVRAFDLSKVLEEQYMDEEEFNTFYKPKMDSSISNVGVRCTGAINLFALRNFLDKYLGSEETAKDFLRVKGVVDITTSDRTYVIQCVHMLKNQSFTKQWKEGEPRENRMIFIGRGMQQRRQELTEGFMACLAKPLRFKVGKKVLIQLGNGYEKGIVLKHWDEFNAYRIQMPNGDNFWAPIDDDVYIKAPEQ
jgi:G3E family GTPase